ncbi:MAG: hypothetical protein P8Y67_10745 [Alphaproteobacteria bacterium]
MSENDKRLASLNEARELFIRSLKTHEHFVYRLGYEAGFAAGWDAVVRRLASTKPDLSAAPDKKDLSDLLPDTLTDSSARDTLISIVFASPGMERYQIVQEALKRLSNLSERAIHTALQRLKAVGDLYVEDGGWYVSAEAPYADDLHLER